MSRKWMLRISVATLVAAGLVGTATIAGATANSDHIWAGEKLESGASQTSVNGQYRLIQQADGNLVEYQRDQKGKYTKPLWSTGTARNPGAATFLQKDGNLVVRKSGKSTSMAIWSSNTATPKVSHLTVQNDGNVVVYTKSGEAIWASQGLKKNAGAIKDDYPARWRDRPRDTVLDDWRMWNRECTSFVAWRVASRNGVDVRKRGIVDASAGKWGDYVGYDYTPVPGAVAESGGHVAWVAEVKGDQVVLEDYNGRVPFGWSSYTSSTKNYRYIHLNDGR